MDMFEAVQKLDTPLPFSQSAFFAAIKKRPRNARTLSILTDF